ncbi:phage tail tape measure protein [Humitalea sp. 24SJ18S-53]|uniref:phage tail tape measure protein n=1 Tax=Humitalea sp. 24SJ18S-53 TaxID=3422307 RepID=UPI003D66FD58
MARDLKARFILELQDRVSSGISAITGRLNALRAVSQRLAGIGLVGAGLTFAGPIQSAAAFEDVLRQSVITQGLVGDAATREVARLTQVYEQLARTTGQRSQAIAEGAATMVAANMPRDAIEPLVAIAARASTAYGASIGDMSRLTISLSQNLRIAPAAMADTLAQMAQAGMEGRFELRDMATEFSRLTPMVEGLGLSGQRGALMLAGMAQMALRGAGTASEAANNLGNFLSKINSPETVRNFAAAGVNLETLVADAARRGINPVEAVVQRVREMSRGNMFRVGALFGDQQVLNFLRPMMSGVGEYLRIVRAASDANASLTDQSFATRWTGFQINVDRATESVTQLGRRMGAAMVPNLRALNDGFDWLFAKLDELDAAHPGMIDAFIRWGGAAMVAVVALGSLSFILPVIVSGAALLFAPLTLLVGIFGAILGVGAAAAIGIALLAAAFVAAGIHIWRNWDRFRGFFAQLFGGIRAIYMGFVAWLAGWFTGTQADRVAAVMQMWRSLTTAFGALWDIIRTLFTDFVAWVDGWTGGAASRAVQGVIGVWQSVAAFAIDLFNAPRQAFDDFVAWVDGWSGGAASAAVQGVVAAWRWIVDGVQGVWNDVSAEFDNFSTAISGWIDSTVVPWIERFKAPWEALKAFFADLFGGIATVFNTIFGPIEAAIARLRGAMPQAPESTTAEDPRAPGRRSFNPGQIMAGQAARLNGEIIVRAAPGTEVVRTESDAPEVRITAPDRGAMLGAP